MSHTTRPVRGPRAVWAVCAAWPVRVNARAVVRVCTPDEWMAVRTLNRRGPVWHACAVFRWDSGFGSLGDGC